MAGVAAKLRMAMIQEPVVMWCCFISALGIAAVIVVPPVRDALYPPKSVAPPKASEVWPRQLVSAFLFCHGSNGRHWRQQPPSLTTRLLAPASASRSCRGAASSEGGRPLPSPCSRLQLAACLGATLRCRVVAAMTKKQ
eukprot:SM000010S04198  [mRNA]  locus=s10:127238:127800:- [translate_table: standard]